MQNKRKLQQLRNKFGVVVTDPDAICTEIANFWQQTTPVTSPPLDQCTTYLHKFFQGKDIAVMAKALIKPLSKDLVHAAQSNLNDTLSGFDGIPCAVYTSFAGTFVPVMFDIISSLYTSETISDTWSLALLNVIPKARGTVTVRELRPLVLQNTFHKWFAACVSLHLQDFIAALTPVQQRGFLKGRYIFDHLWNVVCSLSSMTQGLMCPVDFSKAYNSVSHEYTASFFTLMGLPQYLINVLILLFHAPMALIVHDSFRPDQRIHPTSGIRQGCPLSPTPVALLISRVAVYLSDVNSCIEILLYADDLLIIITPPPPR